MPTSSSIANGLIPPDPDKRDERADKFLIQEYQSMWAYYNRTLDEKHKFIEYYFKVVALPAGLIAIIIAIGKYIDLNGNGIWSQQGIYSIGAMSLAMISTVGIITLTAYIKEDANSRAYLATLRDIRKTVVARYPELASALTIDRHRASIQKNGKRFMGSIGAWRSGLISSINSIIIVGSIIAASHGVGLSAYPFVWATICIFMFAVVLAMHVTWANYMSDTYLARSGVPEERR